MILNLYIIKNLFYKTIFRTALRQSSAVLCRNLKICDFHIKHKNLRICDLLLAHQTNLLIAMAEFADLRYADFKKFACPPLINACWERLSYATNTQA